MTDGSSQGLFVVVAVVIFGIFVAISYSLFRDQLSPALASIFSESTETATDKLLGGKNVLIWDKLSNVNKGEDSTLVKNDDSIILSSNGISFAGIKYSQEALENDTSYVFKFDVELLSGTLSHIGGHMHSSEYLKIFVNGEKISESQFSESDTAEYILSKNQWQRGVPLDGNGKYNIEIHFDTNMWYVDFPYTSNLNSASYRSFYIEGNRYHFGNPYSLKLSNMELIKK